MSALYNITGDFANIILPVMPLAQANLDTLLGRGLTLASKFSFLLCVFSMWGAAWAVKNDQPDKAKLGIFTVILFAGAVAIVTWMYQAAGQDQSVIRMQ